MLKCRAGLMALAVASVVLAASAPARSDGGRSGTDEAAAAGGSLRPFKTFAVNGGYIAQGVGLRNRGFGTIHLEGVPAAATIEGAYLYWTILGPGSKAHQGKFNGTVIRGARIGTGPGPCWPARRAVR